MTEKVKLKISSEDYTPWYQGGNYTVHYSNGNGFVDYSDAEEFCKDLPELHVFMHDSGMFATHNIRCPICLTKHAIFGCNTGKVAPCRDCQDKGFYIGQKVMVNSEPKHWWEILKRRINESIRY